MEAAGRWLLNNTFVNVIVGSNQIVSDKMSARRLLDEDAEEKPHELSVIDKIVFGLGGVLGVFSFCLCLYAMRSLYV